jgi:hypothetical protein
MRYTDNDCFDGKVAQNQRTSRWTMRKTKLSANMKTKITLQNPARLRSLLPAVVLLVFNAFSAFAQTGGTSFNSTDLRTGISNSLAVLMMFGFLLGIASVVYGGFAVRRGDVDQGKMSIIGGAIIAAAPAVVFAFYKIFGLDSNSAVGIGNF